MRGTKRYKSVHCAPEIQVEKSSRVYKFANHATTQYPVGESNKRGNYRINWTFPQQAAQNPAHFCQIRANFHLNYGR
jgi:hypothetical protein